MNYYRFGKYYNGRGSYKIYRCTIDGFIHRRHSRKKNDVKIIKIIYR
jgi:hypothetical protein